MYVRQNTYKHKYYIYNYIYIYKVVYFLYQPQDSMFQRKASGLHLTLLGSPLGPTTTAPVGKCCAPDAFLQRWNFHSLKPMPVTSKIEQAC